MKVGILGAGAIGSYLGASLARHGGDVVLVGRDRWLDAVSQHGLTVAGLDGRPETLGTEACVATTDPAELGTCEVILVTVKSGQTEEAADILAAHAPETSLVVSFQNGLRNADVLRAGLPNPVAAGMVPFNVIWEAPASFRQTTSGHLAIERGPERVEELAGSLGRAGLPTETHENIAEIQWGKLLLNLNNSINALAGVPLKQQLANRDYRRCLAASMSEALTLLSAAGISPKAPLKAPVAAVPYILRAPTPIFRVVAGAMLRIDPTARSSMQDDLERGRKTEVDVLNGEILRLAESVGSTAPVNGAIVELIRAAELHGSPRLSARSLRKSLGV